MTLDAFDDQPHHTMTMSLLDAQWTITKHRLQGWALLVGGVLAYETARDWVYPPPPESETEAPTEDVGAHDEQEGDGVRLVDREPAPSSLVDESEPVRLV